MSFEYARNQRDAAFSTAHVLPAAGANVNTAGLDLGQLTGGQIEGVEAEISIPVTTTLVDAKTITVKLMDSADGTTFTVVDPLTQTSVVGITGNGNAAKVVRFRIPPATCRYIALNLAVEAAGGDNTAKSVELALLF